jgi:uncharacterized integral membrane protein
VDENRDERFVLATKMKLVYTVFFFFIIGFIVLVLLLYMV